MPSGIRWDDAAYRAMMEAQLVALMGKIAGRMESHAKRLMAEPKSGKWYKKKGRKGMKRQKALAKIAALSAMAPEEAKKAARRIYGWYQASAPGESPASPTGALRKSITSEVGVDKGVIIARCGTNLKTSRGFVYPKELEFGTKGGKIAPRPWLRPTLEAVKPIAIELLAAFTSRVVRT